MRLPVAVPGECPRRYRHRPSPTAATHSARFIRHRRRSHRFPIPPHPHGSLFYHGAAAKSTDNLQVRKLGIFRAVKICSAPLASPFGRGAPKGRRGQLSTPSQSKIGSEKPIFASSPIGRAKSACGAKLLLKLKLEPSQKAGCARAQPAKYYLASLRMPVSESRLVIS